MNDEEYQNCKPKIDIDVIDFIMLQDGYKKQFVENLNHKNKLSMIIQKLDEIEKSNKTDVKAILREIREVLYV